MEDHQPEVNEKEVNLMSGSEDVKEKPAERKVSVILEYAERYASSTRPEILLSLCTSLL